MSRRQLILAVLFFAVIFTIFWVVGGDPVKNESGDTPVTSTTTK